MKTIKKLSIILGFAIPTITLALFWNLQCNNEKELVLAVAVVMFFVSWGAGKFIEVGIKSIK